MANKKASISKNSNTSMTKKGAPSNSLMKRYASISPDVLRQTPRFYHPLFDSSNLQLPTKTREINQWCVTPDTLVLMSDYVCRDIKDIQVGDMVISHTGKARKVLKVFKRLTFGKIFKIRTKDFGEIRITPGHKVMIDRKKEKFLPSEKLKVGQEVETFVNTFERLFLKSKIKWIKKIFYFGYVYNLEVEEDHTYIADWFVVSNCRHFYKTDPVVRTSIDLHCLPAGEMVYTEGSVKPIEKITLEDSVLSLEGKYQKVLMTDKHPYSGDIYTIRSWNLNDFTVTAEHPVLVIKGKRIKDKKGYVDRNEITEEIPQWIFAKDVKRGDYLLFPKFKEKQTEFSVNLEKYMTKGKPHNPHPYKVNGDSIITRNQVTMIVPKEIPITEDFCELLGWYVAEGGGGQFTLGKHEPQNIERVLSLWQRTFKYPLRVEYEEKGKGAVSLGIRSLLIIRFLEDICGKRAANKKIPDFVMKASSDCIRAFLKGYFAGDGCFVEFYDVSCNTVSKVLFHQLRLAAAKCGILLTGRYPKKKHEYTLSCSKRYFIPRILNQVYETKRVHPPHYREDDNYFYCEIKESLSKHFKGDVYDIKTEDGTFCSAAIIHNSEFPITGFENYCKDKMIKKFFDNMAFDVLRLPRVLLDVSLDWWKLGNVFPVGMYDEDKGIWKTITIMNPDFVEVDKTIFSPEPILKLDPDESLRRVAISKQPAELYKQLSEIDGGRFVRYLARGEKVPFNPIVLDITDPNTGEKQEFSLRNVWHLAFKLSPYETVGTPLMYDIFKPLIYKDEVRAAQKSIISRNIIPIKVVKVGSDTIPATPQAIQEIKAILDQLSENPNGFLVYHHAISIEYIAGAGHVIPMQSEYDWIDKEMLAGLGISRAMILGEGPSYSPANNVAFQILINRYLRYQTLLADWIENAIYKPIAEIQGFWEIDSSTKEKKAIYPKVKFELMRLKDDVAQKRLVAEMSQKGFISKRSAVSTLGFRYDEEEELITQEKQAIGVKQPDLPKTNPLFTTPGLGGGGGGLPPMPLEEGEVRAPGTPGPQPGLPGTSTTGLA